MKVLLFLTLFLSFALAQNITISDIYIDKENYGLQKVEEQKLFEAYGKDCVNLGYVSHPVFVKFVLSNDSNRTIKRVLAPTDPRFEEMKLYDEHFVLHNNNRFSKNRSKAILPYFIVEMKPNSTQKYYLKAASRYGNLNFSLRLQKQRDFFKDDAQKQHIIILFMGILIAFIFYGIMLYAYGKNSTYLFYSIYLIVFLYHQCWYLGLSYIYLPQELSEVYTDTMIIQISALIVTFAFFVMRFLKLDKFPVLNRIYRIFIIVAIFEAIVLSFVQFHSPDIVVATGTISILFSNTVGIYVYMKGVREAKYFVIGYAIASIAFFIIILDYLGFTTVTQSYPYIILVATAIEALIFLLAFFEQHSLMQQEYVKTKVIKKELELQRLHTREIQHRVKNNLEMILSIIDMQSSDAKDKLQFENLKNRIFAMAHNYNMLSSSGEENVEMRKYVTELIESIKSSIQKDKNIDILVDIDSDIEFALDKSIYIGLIINELVVNSFKYAFDEEEGELMVSLKKEDDGFVLIVEDNGKGFDMTKREGSFGLILVEKMVASDLKGEISSLTHDRTKHMIRF